MESLLCNEVWLMSPNAMGESDELGEEVPVSVFASEQECEQVVRNILDKETKYTPESGYLESLLTNDLMRSCRFKAVNWLVESRKRLDLSLGTVFIAVNCLDRFASLPRCKGWKDWMFELLSIACLSVASKFNETDVLSLREFQGNGLLHSFAPSLIQRMELTLLKGLGWRLASTTSFSYLELLINDDLNKTLVMDSRYGRVTELLINVLLDPKFLEFRPHFIAISAVKCVFGDVLHPTFDTSVFAFLNNLVSQNQDDFCKCQRAMEKLQDQNILAPGNSWNDPSSPVTVLLEEEWFNICSTDSRSSKKRERRTIICDLN
ncbi:putative cyclin-D7-1 [Andrographis paniculata]|uniref:putative cyclin-D7-1 n=1 Tax=Andrographis paniculata TaxID=175694 RepID=UPI0021E94BB4|nr:putative cyclin-D7-1 [Andrographis paniculata]